VLGPQLASSLLCRDFVRQDRFRMPQYSLCKLIQKGITPIRSLHPPNELARIGRIFIIPRNISGNRRVMDKVTQDEGGSVDLLHGPGKAFRARRLNVIVVVDAQKSIVAAWDNARLHSFVLICYEVCTYIER
jgi:hypothetical protein